MHAGFDPEPLYWIVQPSTPPTSDKLIADLKFEVESLRLELLLSQPLLPQLLLPQSPAQPPQQTRSAFNMTNDTGIMEHGAQPTTVDVFSIADCRRIPKQGGTSYF